RWNGVDFQSLVQVCCGNDAYEATLLAYVDPEAWEDVPHMPPSELRGAARLVKLVSSVQGELLQISHEQELSELRSLVRFEPEPEQAGGTVKLTVDLATCAGYAYLLHGDPSVTEKSPTLPRWGGMSIQIIEIRNGRS
ncbi:MAG: hypothetical protein SGPRY_011595, partial [Prymnesium sp.]